MKSTWTILNEVINNKKRKINLLTTFNVDDKEISDPFLRSWTISVHTLQISDLI